MRSVRLLIVVCLLVFAMAACGQPDSSSMAAGSSPVGEIELGRLNDPDIALPAADGSWGILDPGDQGSAPPPCLDGIEVTSLTLVSAAASRSSIVAADGVQVFVSGYSGDRVGAVPPGVKPGDPIALAAMRCDPVSGIPGSSLLLGSIGLDGRPTGLTAIAGVGAPEGAPQVGQPRDAEFWVAFSVQRDTLVVVISTPGGPEPCCYGEELWSYDIPTGVWSQPNVPAQEGAHQHGLPSLLANGGLIENITDGQTQWTTYRGETLWRQEEGVVVDVAADASAALFTVLGSEYQWVVLGQDGELRSIFTGNRDGYTDYPTPTAQFGPNASVAYAGLWSFVPAPSPGMGGETVLGLWEIDLTSGIQTKIMDLPGVIGFRVLPRGGGLLVNIGQRDDPESQTWEIWPLPSR